MIEFFGVQSEKCKIETAKKRNKSTVLWFWIAIFLLGIIPTVVLGVLRHKEFYEFLALTGAAILIMIFNMLSLPKSKVLKFRIPQRIIFENNNITLIAYQGQEVIEIRSFKKIKKIIDAGDWFYIIFKFGDISNSWICEKQLITQGTIEEFEKLFEGKIVRKK